KGVFQAKSLGDLSQLIEMAQYLGFACVGLVMALVATTTVMAVQDRVQEYAVLQTLGFSASRIFGFVLSESSILSFTGGTIGVIAAMITLYFSQLSVAAEAVAVAFTPSLTLALQGILISIFAGLLAGAAPAWQAASTEVAPALRHG
ncbi:MAG: FtsX-like permease family protein, partial [Blastopirellula sp. JB062]